MLYSSPCRACDHKHDGLLCTWQVCKTGQIKLRPVYSSLWGLTGGHEHDYEDVSRIISTSVNFYRDEEFEYKQEIDCGCKCYVPSDNLEFLEWKYNESTKST